MAGTSLDVSAKVYGVKVDDTHSYGMNLATTMIATRNKNAEHGNGKLSAIRYSVIFDLYKHFFGNMQPTRRDKIRNNTVS